MLINAELDTLAETCPDAYRWFLEACVSEENIVLPHEYVLPLQRARLIEYGMGDTTDYVIHWARVATARGHIPRERTDTEVGFTRHPA